MRKKTALFILQDLVRRKLLTVQHTTFHLSPYPEVVDPLDVIDAFEAMRYAMSIKTRGMLVSHRHRLSVWTSDPFFEKLFKVLYSNQKLYPVPLDEVVEEGRPLPNLFVSSEKTQVRQIPLVDEPPWPFRFLLELGGMIVCRPKDKREFLESLRQYLNNHPQYRVKVDAKEWETGEVAVYTWWIAHVPDNEIRGNVNVPERS